MSEVIELEPGKPGGNSAAKTSLPMPSQAVKAAPLTAQQVYDEHDISSENWGTKAITRMSNANLARFTFGISPIAITQAFSDWWLNLMYAPGKQVALMDKAVRKTVRYASYASRAAVGQVIEPCIKPLPQDHRFSNPAWQNYPFNLLQQGFLLQQQWWHNATTGIRGMSKHHEFVVDFTIRQMLDTFSPSNFPWLNPEVIETSVRRGGANLAEGMSFWFDDFERLVTGANATEESRYHVGENLEVTPGRVVFRSDLIELIQYSPATEQVQREPLLIVPAWIMKYYILDLSPHNSLVRYMVDQGFTVFMISWKNPSPHDRYVSFDDYLRLGIMAAIDAISEIIPDEQIHATGYCLGGTLLSIAAATMGRDGDQRLKSVSLFAAQTDFTEAGELTLFIDESQVTFIEDVMWSQGYLDAKQMAGAFQVLRSNDLIWSWAIRRYMLAEKPDEIDLMAWNADSTRMPYRMHSQYLKQLFLNNDLSAGRFCVDGRAISVSNIHEPMFIVATEQDHVAPWKSVYKIHLQADTDITFVLTKGGHNAGIVSEPGHPRRHYRISCSDDHSPYADPEQWLSTAELCPGSWWPAWKDWLQSHSTDQVEAREPTKFMGVGQTLAAPGLYVHQR